MKMFYVRIDKNQLIKQGYPWYVNLYYRLLEKNGANKELPHGIKKPRSDTYFMDGDENHIKLIKEYQLHAGWKQNRPELVSLGDIEKALLQDNENKLLQDIVKGYKRANLRKNIGTLVEKLNMNESNLPHRLGIETLLAEKGRFCFEPISIIKGKDGFYNTDSSKEYVLYNLNNYPFSKMRDYIIKGLIKYGNDLKQHKEKSKQKEDEENRIYNERIYNDPHIEDIPELGDQI